MRSSIMTPDMCYNYFSRVHLLANIIERHYFNGGCVAFGSAMWEPLVQVDGLRYKTTISILARG